MDIALVAGCDAQGTARPRRLGRPLRLRRPRP